MGSVEVEHVRMRTNGVSLHVAAAGPKDGPLVVLLHGFPEFWYGWRRFIQPLAERGFRVLAPDQRGYNISDKPRGLGAYTLDELARDVSGLIEASGRTRAHLVGHDWGAAVAWWTAVKSPTRVERLVAINVPHPRVMWRQLLTNPTQLRRSWYMLFFQLPLLPERAFLHGGSHRAIRLAFERGSRPGTFTSEELEEYRRAWRERGAMPAMLNWYRAALRHPPSEPRDLRVRPPTLVIWGTADAFLGEELIDPSLALCDDGRAERLPGCTHWVVHEEPKRVLELIVGHLEGPARAA
jgi:pimeloyl-ACP methyl ester carboxylesterase